MATYKVTAPGFYEGRLYSPNGKRRVLTTEKPFPKSKKPSWVEPMKASDEKVVDDVEAGKTEGSLSDEAGEDTSVTFIGDQASAVETL